MIRTESQLSKSYPRISSMVKPLDNRNRWLTVAIIVSCWTLFGLFFASQRYVERAYADNPTSWSRVLTAWAACSYMWAALTPLVFWLSRRFPFTRKKWTGFLLIHASAGILISVVHLGAYLVALQVLFGGYDFASIVALRYMVVAEVHFNLLLYAAIVGIAHFIDYHRQKRDREVNSAELEAKLVKAQDAAQHMQQGRHLERVAVKVKERVVLLNTFEIDWIESQDNYVKIHRKREAYMLRETLTSLAGKLDPAKFLRIRRSTLVNVERVKELLPLFNREYILVLHDGTQLQSSRRYRKNLDSLLQT